MAIVTVHQAKTQLSKLIARAEAGEEIVIARGDVPAVKLTPVGRSAPKRQFGAMKGRYEIPDSFFFDPLPEDELSLYVGADEEDPAR
jgi:antitoxin (DNA-binding transcriptional repressor) of toxin-antitoxin stability system